MPTRRPARLAALLAVLALAAPAVAGAQRAPSLGAPEQTQTTPTVATTASSSDGGLQTWQELLIFGAGVVLLGGIAWAIVSDARSRAPVADRRRPAAADGAGPSLPPAERRRRKQRARQKARAARASRKRNR
jgi:hypothetical protein